MECYFCNEHNEAFSIIEYSKISGKINKKNNLLLHVDAHEDNLCNQTITSIYGLPSKKCPHTGKVLMKFAKNELYIFSFIKPLLLLGTVGEMVWVFPKWINTKSTKKKIYRVASTLGEGKIIRDVPEKNYLNLKKYLYPDMKEYYYSKSSISSLDVKGQECILGIDFDYFACDVNITSRIIKKIEITKEEYSRLKKEEYFHFGSLGINKKLIKEKTKYFLKLSHLKGEQKPLIKKFSDIKKEVEKIFRHLRKNDMKIKLVIVCRSKYSGYTPDRYLALIEESIRESIRRNFPECKIMN